MKIADGDTIRSSEAELIDTITGDLDWTALERTFKQRHNLDIQDDVEYTKGALVVYKEQVAYKLDFEVKVNISVIFDREGNSLSMTTQEEDKNVSDNDLSETGNDEDSQDEYESDSDNLNE